MVNTKYLYTIATLNGFTHKQVKDYILKEFNLTTTKDLDKKQYVKAIAFLSKEEFFKQKQERMGYNLSKSLNKVTLIGNLGKEPELKYTPSGIAYCSFSIATSESWKDNDGNAQEKTEWHNIVAWRKLAEICGEYLKKGSKVYLEGKLQTSSYEKDGVKQYSTKIVADQMIMLDGKGIIDNTQPTQQPEIPNSSSKDDDLPF